LTKPKIVEFKQKPFPKVDEVDAQGLEFTDSRPFKLKVRLEIAGNNCEIEMNWSLTVLMYRLVKETAFKETLVKITREGITTLFPNLYQGQLMFHQNREVLLEFEILRLEFVFA